MFAAIITVIVLSVMCLVCLLNLVEMVRESWGYISHGKAIFYAFTILLTTLAYANFIFDSMEIIRNM